MSKETISFAAPEATKRHLAREAARRGVTIAALLEQHHAGRRVVSDLSAGETVKHMLRASFPLVAGHEKSEALLRVVAESGTGDTVGLHSVGVVPDLVAFVDASRPGINSAFRFTGPRGMPAKGKTFTRPKVTSFPTADTQTEKAELDSTQLATSTTTLTKVTHGSVNLVTEQDLDWSDDGFFDGLAEACAAANAISTESAFTAAVEAKVTTNTVDCDDITSMEPIAQAVGAAQSALIGTAGVPGDVLYIGADMLETLTGATGQLAVPELFPTVVYSPGFSADFVAVGVSRFMEAFEAVKGLVLATPTNTVNVGTTDVRDLVPVPSHSERTIAYRSYFVPKIYAEALCGIVPAE